MVVPSSCWKSITRWEPNQPSVARKRHWPSRGRWPLGRSVASPVSGVNLPRAGLASTSAPVKVFGCRPLTNHATPCGGRRTKTSKGGNRGRDGRAAPQVPGLWGFECREWRDVVAAGELADGVCCGRSGCRSVRRPLSGADRWWRAGEVTVNGGHVPRAVVAGEWPEARMIISQSDEAGERDH
jgi:hypothetical protein